MPDELTPYPSDLDRFGEIGKLRAVGGYIVWRRGTGDNVELLHIRATRSGMGVHLLRGMLYALRHDPPYGGEGTVFGFTREGNMKARHWYRDMGFTLTDVEGVYAEGFAVLFSATYKTLVEIHYPEGFE